MLIISPALADGIDYAGMMTDQQHMGYVCHLGESTPPQGLIDGLAQTNWMQDTILEEMQVGRTGECSCATPLAAARAPAPAAPPARFLCSCSCTFFCR